MNNNYHDYSDDYFYNAFNDDNINIDMEFNNEYEDFQDAIPVTYNDNEYYSKYFNSTTNALASNDMWIILYNEPGLLLQTRIMPILSEDYHYVLFPKLGNCVNTNCKTACRIAQKKLMDVGYYHTDLYENNGYYNCSNVREINGDYYPIDTIKIIRNTYRGGSKKKFKQKSKRIKHRRRKTIKKLN